MKYKIFIFDNKPKFEDLKSNLHTLFPYLKDRENSSYRNVQVHNTYRQLHCVAINEEIEVLENNLKNLDQRKVHKNNEILRFKHSISHTISNKVHDRVFLYRIDNWIPFFNGNKRQTLNPELTDYDTFKKIESFGNYEDSSTKKERIWNDGNLHQALEELLYSQINYLYTKTTGGPLKEKSFFSIQYGVKSNIQYYKNRATVCFQIYFTSNLKLPIELGIGYKISEGYGRIIKPKN